MGVVVHVFSANIQISVSSRLVRVTYCNPERSGKEREEGRLERQKGKGKEGRAEGL